MKKKIEIKKLVRDKTLFNFKENNIKYKSTILNRKVLKEKLLLKLLEEVQEVIESTNHKHLTEELCDVWEVFSKILDVNSIKFADIISLCNKKNKERGAFKKNIFVEWVEIDEDHPFMLKGYFKNYPVIEE